MRKPLIAVVTIVAGSAFALAGCVKPPPPPPPGHCVSPSGFDLNAQYGVEDPLVTPFCTAIPTSTHWRSATRWVTAPTHEVVPPGYRPSAEKPIDDFDHKFVSARYVIDAGTPHARSSTFRVGQMLNIRNGVDAHAWASGLLTTLPEGTHTVAIYITLTADHWDGIAANPAENLIPAGESLFDQTTFEVVDPD